MEQLQNPTQTQDIQGKNEDKEKVFSLRMKESEFQKLKNAFGGITISETLERALNRGLLFANIETIDLRGRINAQPLPKEIVNQAVRSVETKPIETPKTIIDKTTEMPKPQKTPKSEIPKGAMDNIPKSIENKSEPSKIQVDNVHKQTEVNKGVEEVQQKSTMKSNVDIIPKNVEIKPIDLPKSNVDISQKSMITPPVDKTKEEQKTIVDNIAEKQNFRYHFHDKPTDNNRIGKIGERHYHTCSKCGFKTWHER